MATREGLVRSFYGWLFRTGQVLKESGNETYSRLLPTYRPTSLPAVTRLALHSVRVLRETPFEEKAVYWANLFSGIERDGWQGETRPIDADRNRLREELEAVSGELALQD